MHASMSTWLVWALPGRGLHGGSYGTGGVELLLLFLEHRIRERGKVFVRLCVCVCNGIGMVSWIEVIVGLDFVIQSQSVDGRDHGLRQWLLLSHVNVNLWGRAEQ